MNRSPATIAAFLMATEGMSWEDAMADIQRVRKKCRPRPEYKVAAEKAVVMWKQRRIVEEEKEDTVEECNETMLIVAVDKKDGIIITGRVSP